MPKEKQKEEIIKEFELLEGIIKESSRELPLDIERFGGEYCQGMHAGIDLCIDKIRGYINHLEGK